MNINFKMRSLAAVLLAFTLLCGCADKGGKTSEATVGKDTSLTASTQAEPVTLEQALLKERGKPYDQSDYKKIIGGEGIIDITSEFDCFVDHSYSTTIDNMIISGGKTDVVNSAGAVVTEGAVVCPNCKAQMSAGAKFCSKCGAKLNTKCPNCGANTAEGSAFCSECGQKL